MTGCTDEKLTRKMRRHQYPLPFQPSFSPIRTTQWISSPSNDAARAFLDKWVLAAVEQPGHGVVLAGPPSSGKTSLTQQIIEHAGGRILCGRDLSEGLDIASKDRFLAIDDVDQIEEPDLLTRFINVCYEKQVSYLLVGAEPVDKWPEGKDGTSRDLATRLGALPKVTIDRPDESLLAKVLLNWLTDRQISLSSELSEIAVQRLKRSFRSLEILMEHLDAEAMQQQKSIDKTLIQQVLNSLPEHTLS